MKIVTAIMCACLGLFAFEEVNILKSVGFTGNPNFMPGTLDCWNVEGSDIEYGPIKVLKGEGPDGVNAVRLNIPNGEVFRQQNIYLPVFVVGGFILPEAEFSGVQVKNGRAIGD